MADPISIFDYDAVTLDTEIEKLDEEVSTSMTEITRLLELKYRDCCPLFSALGECQEKIQTAFDAGREKLDRLESSLRSVEDEVSQASSNQPSRKLATIKRIIEGLSTLSEMERSLNELWLTAEDGHDGGLLLPSVLHVLRLEELGRELEKEETLFHDSLSERIIPLLFVETSSRRGDLLAELDEFWRGFIRFPNVEKTRPGMLEMRVKLANRETTSKNLTALKKLDEFDRRLEDVVEALWKGYCDKMLHTTDLPAKSLFSAQLDEGELVLAILRVVPQAEGVPTPKCVFNSLAGLFEALYKAFSEVSVDGVDLTRCVGTAMADRLTSNLIKDVLVPAIPSGEAQSCISKAKKVLTDMCDEFHSATLKKLGFFDEVNPLQSFIDNYERHAVDKRCNYFVVKARELVVRPYIELMEVGSAEDEDEEAVGELARKTDERLRLDDNASLPRGKEWDKFSIKLFQFQKCKISKSTFDLVLLLQDCLLAAVEAGTDVEACRLFTTARNLLEIFTSIAPIHHQQALTTVPQIAAIFFNNCHYICHRLMSIKPDLQQLLANSTKLPHNECSFVEYFEELRLLAGNILNQHLTQIRCHLSANLDSDSVFVDLRDEKKRKQCERSLDACTMQINQISIVWREVMPTTVFTHSIGVLVSHLLTLLVDAILAKVDISSADAEVISHLFTRVVKKTEKILTIRDEPTIHRVCEEPYQRINETIFCLGASMAEIAHRWCEGKGLLAASMKPSEVKILIRALFQNTERRAQLIAAIN